MPSLLILAFAVLGAAPRPDAPASSGLTFGIGAPNGDEQARRAKSLIEPYFSKALGRTVRVQILSEYEQLPAALVGGKVDVAWVTAIAYDAAHASNPGVTAVMKARRNGASYYRTAFIVRKDSPVKSLVELRGKRVAWVARGSASGYLFPRALLVDAGVDPDAFFSNELVVGSHPAVCKAVRSGEADVGATLSDQPASGSTFQADGCVDAPPVSDFRVIAASEPIPNDVVAIRAGIDRAVAGDLSTALAHMADTAGGRQVLTEAFRVEAWAPVADRDFAPVERVRSTLAAFPPPAQVPKLHPPDAGHP